MSITNKKELIKEIRDLKQENMELKCNICSILERIEKLENKNMFK